MSLFNLNSDAQLANDILLEFLLYLYFIGHLTFEQTLKLSSKPKTFILLHIQKAYAIFSLL